MRCDTPEEEDSQTPEDLSTRNAPPIKNDSSTEEVQRTEDPRSISYPWRRERETWLPPGEDTLTEEDGPPCEACRQINFESLQVKRLLPGRGLRRGYIWHASVDALVKSRKTCKLCRTLSDPYIWRLASGRPWDYHENINYLQDGSVWLRLVDSKHLEAEIAKSRPNAGSDRHTSTRGQVSLELGLVQRQPGHEAAFWEDWLLNRRDSKMEEVVTFEGDAAAEMTNIPVIRSCGSSTASATAFATAQQWLSDCVSISLSDEAKADPHEDVTSRPRRLLQIDRGYVTRLIDIADLPINVSYATLSYTWGEGEAPWKTLTTNVAERQSRFEVELPRTIQDAITITYKLDIPYLWVDALCIIQDDDMDWRFEAAKMGKIFQNCVLCVAANTGYGSDGGCFNEASDRPPDVVEIVSQIHDGRASRLGIVSRDEYSSSHDRYRYRYSTGDTGPLSERAWVLQERILSPRILYYTEQQLFWECEHCALAEDGLPLDTLSSSGRLPANSRLRSLMRQEHLVLEKGMPTLSELWYNYLVGDMYFRRKMTYEKDRLVALSGIVKAFAVKKQPARYIAGLWDDDLHYGLSWIAEKGRGQRTSQYQAPSWSWASRKGPVHYRIDIATALKSCDIGFTFKRCIVSSLGEDEFGGIEGARLELETRLVADRLVVVPRDDRVFEPRALERLQSEYGDYSWKVCIDAPAPDQTVEVKCMLLVLKSRNGHGPTAARMLILSAVDERETYERIGLSEFRYDEMPNGLVAEFKATPLQTITLV